MLDLIEIEPKQPVKKVIIWLHGLGASGNDFLPIKSYFQDFENLKFIFPNAPVRKITINNNIEMRAWYDIKNYNLLLDIDEKGIRDSSEEIDVLVQQQISTYGINASDVIIAGFSQGGAIALYNYINSNTKVGGIVALSTYIPMNELKSEPLNDKTKILVAHGLFDPIVPFHLGVRTKEYFNSNQLSMVWKQLPIQHTVSQEELKEIVEFIKSTLQTVH
jgi:phospholipase/carboxylesterase